MKRYFRVILVAAVLLGFGSPIHSDNCYQCLYGDLCVPVPPGWGNDSCTEVIEVVICGVSSGVPINCIITSCDVGPTCTIVWDLA